MSAGRHLPLPVRGSFSLAESADFGFGQRDAAQFDGVMRLGFCLDGYREQVGVAMRQRPGGDLELEVDGSDDDAAVLRQVARVLSVDVDATGYDALGERNALVSRLQGARPGLRPPLFHSAYEALAWSTLAARRPQAQMARVRDRLCRDRGAVLEVAGEDVLVFPTPERLLEVEELAGVPQVNVDRMRGVAESAAAGDLDTPELRGLDPADAVARLRRLAGIGPFYAELVVLRTLGHTDLLPTLETGATEIAGRLLGREPFGAEDFVALAASWSPWRTWVTVALRAAGPRLLPDDPPGHHYRGPGSRRFTSRGSTRRTT